MQRGAFSVLYYLWCLGFFLMLQYRQYLVACGLLYMRRCRWVTERRNSCALGSAGLVGVCCKCSWGWFCFLLEVWCLQRTGCCWLWGRKVYSLCEQFLLCSGESA